MILPSLGNWSYTGFMASRIQDIDIAWLVGLFITSVVYLLLARSFDLEAENAAIRASDAQLLAIDRETEAETTS
jgi:hypothetical protein